MLQKFEINGVHVSIDDRLRSHVNNKIGGLDHYISRHSRESAHAEVLLKESKSKDNNSCICEVILYMPKDTIVVKESASTMYAAVDVSETKLKQQLKKYKDLHGNGKLHRHLFGRFRRKQGTQ
jgi:putative sigma-54 modulation protein